MCGICGIINRDRERAVAKADLQAMCDAIIHRGPDEEGQYLAGPAGLGMRRLAIIDLASGQQPIFNEERTAAIILNGEIYNHLDLRRELEGRGHRFHTQADTEAILHAWEEWGEACPSYLNGMFAFAIWDEKHQRLFIARDRIGKKPLYYYHDERRLVFASEIKAILTLPDIPRVIDPRALDAYLTFEYIPAPMSIFKGIHKLPQAHWLTLDDHGLRIQRYWRLQYQAVTRSEAEAAEAFRDLLRDATRIRLMSEVPLGAFLSGGLDSSAVVAMMSQTSSNGVKTYSIGFDNASYNELPWARQVARYFGTEHHEEILTPDAVGLTERIVHQLDEPLGDFSVFPTWMVSEMARRHVTVALSGDGGDELLGGYETYIAEQLARRYQRLPRWLRRGVIEPAVALLPPTEKKKGFFNKSRRFIEGCRLPADLQHVRWMIFLQEAEKGLLYHPALREQLSGRDPYGFIRLAFAESGAEAPLDQQEYVDIVTYLVDDIMVKVDRMSMAVSLETRAPFLDYRMVEFCATLPPNLRLNGKRSKYILKQAFRGILPEEILNRRKEGFSIPIKRWMKEELRPMMLDYLSPAALDRSGCFEPAYVQRLIREHLEGTENHSHRLWALLMFQMWYARYIRP
ncbi:MAG TPA: asparagine synthase (glutamine-hydrolyzing) [bacterium]|nr:asparagine synthase (glutamine-hydrolyzing) [bacterium]HQG45875.1 asparagine synthase (glutamine-hydrolyzing) [bacterium]HQI47249.1 asparagine synthase (glutamine-hydrolyzing) [bacterium]HQJ64242.1 asparagine synthase (glutamine-hydrolyzing) [bacterium]